MAKSKPAAGMKPARGKPAQSRNGGPKSSAAPSWLRTFGARTFLGTQPSTARKGPGRVAVLPPLTVRIAAWLMYAGAVLAVLDLVVTLTTVGSAKHLVANAHPHWSTAKVTSTVHAEVAYLFVVWLITFGLWIVMARTNLAGRGWARIVASILCALSTLSFAEYIAGSSSIGIKLVLIPMWLVGVVAIFLLWRPETSAYIREGKEES